MTNALRVVSGIEATDRALRRPEPLLDDADYFLIKVPGLYRYEADVWTEADAKLLGVPTTPCANGDGSRVERRMVNRRLGLILRPALDSEVPFEDREAELDRLPACRLRLADLS